MKTENWLKVKAIFDSVVEIPTDERDAFLEIACVDDEGLRREVEDLLAALGAAGSFMEVPLAGKTRSLLPNSAADQLQPGRVFSRYKIIRKIGEGGMGKVYLAQDTHLRRFVAIKLLSTDAVVDPDRLLRFMQEARLASALNHPNIITIYEVGRDGNVPFISTEFVAGDTLRRRLSHEPLQVADALHIAIDIASALVVAHEADIVHRDIKPENIMLREDGYLKLLDFGLAKLGNNQGWTEKSNKEEEEDGWSSVKTSPGIIMGTVRYMSPEQIRGIEVDARTDIWSLGVVLYEMIVGRPPFRGTTRSEIMASILKIEPKPLKKDLANLRPRLWQIIKKSLSKEPDERYQAMREMLDDLKSLRREIETEIDSNKPRSIAILPFINLDRDQNVGFFEFALADAVITELARSSTLVVRPSSAIARYLGKMVDPLTIGNELNVDTILTANFLVTKKRIRVTPQLIDVSNKNVVWAEQIDSDADDIIGLQDTITHRVVKGLNVELRSSRSPELSLPVTGNTHAYMEYLRGRDQFRRYIFHTMAEEDVEIAIGHFKRAIDLDPRFALAHSALGTSFIQRVLKLAGERKDLNEAAAAFDEALSIDPQMIEARAYRAMIFRLQGNAPESRKQLFDLRRDTPNNFETQYMSAGSYRLDGEYENAFQCYSEMLRIDPTAKVTVHCFRARFFWYQGKFEQAFHELEQGRKLEPNHPLVGFFHAIVTFLAGDPAAAAISLRSLLNKYSSDSFRPHLSMCLSALGKHESALNELTEETEKVAVVNPDVSYWLASAYLMAGKTDLAFEWLERSVWLGNHNLPWLESNPIWKQVHHDPRFKELMHSLTRPASVNRN